MFKNELIWQNCYRHTVKFLQKMQNNIIWGNMILSGLIN